MVFVSVLLLLGLTPGASELLENTVHLAQHGHLAHSVSDGDTHGPLDAEHGCAGTFHLCSCCVGISCLTSQSATLAPRLALPASHESNGTRIETLPSSGLDHPPKA